MPGAAQAAVPGGGANRSQCEYRMASEVGSARGVASLSGHPSARAGPVRQRRRLRSHLWRDTCRELGIRHKRTRPYRPQTNGKFERFHRTPADGWAYARCYTSETERRGELDGWLHYYNHHRPHTACGNQPPFSRLTNVPGQYRICIR